MPGAGVARGEWVVHYAHYDRCAYNDGGSHDYYYP
jgi:hypothetical protein